MDGYYATICHRQFPFELPPYQPPEEFPFFTEHDFPPYDSFHRSLLNDDTPYNYCEFDRFYATQHDALDPSIWRLPDEQSECVHIEDLLAPTKDPTNEEQIEPKIQPAPFIPNLTSSPQSPGGKSPKQETLSTKSDNATPKISYSTPRRRKLSPKSTDTQGATPNTPVATPRRKTLCHRLSAKSCITKGEIPRTPISIPRRRRPRFKKCPFQASQEGLQFISPT